MMRHAKGYTAYAKQDGLRPHPVEAALTDGRLCCRLCSYPLAGKTYQIYVLAGWLPKLLNELCQWGQGDFIFEGRTIYTNSKDVVDVATATFIDAQHLLRVTEIE